ncbi:SIT4 phosphatase-associated protein-domain-containing protein [Mucidula mucida]|nr:SIT4 phosphatase-associated protein-domain-containing protein [Mucidula mucida]
MFWRCARPSGIDALLDKDDVSLEAILDEDELLQECKAQNTRLLDYFQRADVLQRLLGYVTGEIDGEERGKFKYPYVATEVLCSEIWSIVETCINEQTQLLVPFWESLLDRSPEEMRTQMVMASHFAKINAVFMNKKPAEMLAFIQSLPNVVERILKHVENPSFVDLLVRIIQLDEYPGGTGVLEWLSSQHLMDQLIERLAPEHHPELHLVIAELIKGIISLATPSPGSSVTDGVQNGTSSNLFARELARRESISQLVGYSLRDFGPDPRTKTCSNPLLHLSYNPSARWSVPWPKWLSAWALCILGPVLEIVNENLPTLVKYLKSPRSSTGPVASTVGTSLPLTFERFRICELIAELLHCSNMSLLNRPLDKNNIYDEQGRLTGGLAGLEELATLVGSSEAANNHDSMEDIDEMEPAMELPISHSSQSSRSSQSPSLLDSDEDMSDDDAMEAMEIYEEVPISTTPPRLNPSPPQPPMVVPSSPNAASLPPPAEIAARARSRSRSNSAASDSSTAGQRSRSSRASSRRFTFQEPTLDEPVFIGEKVKLRLLELKVMPTLLDLFFEYPWNNFLHSAVYDIIHQILTGNLESGYNRELAVSLFRDARLMYRIVEGQKHNDVENAKPKGVRLGYMGHLHMISEDVLIALESFPPEARLLIIQYAPDPDWDEYVTGRYLETKKRDSMLLGGGKPVIGSGFRTGGAGRWKVDEADTNTLTISGGVNGGADAVAGGSELKGEFRRATSDKRREGSADFGVAMHMDEEDSDEEDDTPPHFARYLTQQMNNNDSFGSDDEDEEGGWLSRSSFTLGNPPVTARHQSTERRPLSASGFDDTFDPGSSIQDPFSSADDDDAFGPFSDSAAVSSNDAFFTSLSDEMAESSFESFGDFGEFQGAADGELTPTAGSWTFASDGSDTPSSGDGSPSPSPKSGRRGRRDIGVI